MTTSQRQVAHGGELSPGMDVGGYLIEAKIGEGGMGIVYGAKHPKIGKRVAIKVLSPAFCRDPSTVERFEQEARLVNEIRHGNIVDVFQLGELPDGRKYLVMEWLEGQSLTDRIDRGAIPSPEAISILDAIGDAMQAVHEKGVVHRDLKSDNIFLASIRGEQKVKLLDFGLAKLAGENNPKSITKTKTGIVVGTPAYLSPEQARGKLADHRTDVYQLGVLAHKMLTGRLPFVGDSPVDFIVQHLQKPPPSPRVLAPDVPEALAQLVMGMMGKVPEERPTISDMRKTLASIRDGSAAPAPAPAPSPAPVAAAPGSPAPAAAPAGLMASPSGRAQYILWGITLALIGTIVVGLVVLASR